MFSHKLDSIYIKDMNDFTCKAKNFLSVGTAFEK